MNLNELFFAGFGVLILLPIDIQKYFDFVPFQSLNMINEHIDSICECLLVRREGKYCIIWSEKKKVILCTCQVNECLTKIIGLLADVFEERTPYVLFHGSVVRERKGNNVIFLGQNHIGKSTMLQYMIEKKGAIYISDDIVFLNANTMRFESNQYLPILHRERNANGVFEEKYITPAQNWISESRPGGKKTIFIYLVCREGETKMEEILGYEKVIILLASLWRKDRKYMSTICDLASTMEMYKCCFDELGKRIDIIFSLLGDKIDEEDY